MSEMLVGVGLYCLYILCFFDCNASLSLIFFSLSILLFPGYPHGHASFPVRLTRLFAHVLCNSPYGLRQAQNMSGSVLLTTEASQLSVGIAGEAALCKSSKIDYWENYIFRIFKDSIMIVKNIQQIDKFT